MEGIDGSWPTVDRVQLPALRAGKEIFFLSDLHLGCFAYDIERKRERLWLQFLRTQRKRLQGLFLLGDIFDFWCEYRRVIPRGFVRLQAYLGELVEAGVAVHYLIGNHDFLLGDYFPTELGVQIHPQPLSVSIGTTHIYAAHGNGLGKGDIVYKIANKWVANSKVCRYLFNSVHPNIGMGFAYRWLHAKRYRGTQPYAQTPNADMGNQRLFNYAHALAKQYPARYRYYLFAHTHRAQYRDLVPHTGSYINLGDGIYKPTYGVLDSAGSFSLHTDQGLCMDLPTTMR